MANDTDQLEQLRAWRRRLLAAMAAWKADPSNIRWRAVQAVLDEQVEGEGSGLENASQGDSGPRRGMS